MSIDDLAHEAEVKAEILRAVSSMTPEKAERLLIELAFAIKGAAPKAKSVSLPEACAAMFNPANWIPPEPIDVRTRAPAGTLSELPQRIVDFVDNVGGSTMSDIKDRCSNARWSRNRVGTEVFNLTRSGVLEPLDVPPADDGKKYAWFRVAKTKISVEAPAT